MATNGSLFGISGVEIQNSKKDLSKRSKEKMNFMILKINENINDVPS